LGVVALLEANAILQFGLGQMSLDVAVWFDDPLSLVFAKVLYIYIYIGGRRKSTLYCT
jgi:hypothetical protein